MSKPLNILIVEDEYITQKTIAVYLTEMGYRVVGKAMNANDAITILENNIVDFALLDITIQGNKDGIWLANYINEKYKIPHVFLTAYADEVTIKNAIATNPYGYLIKPFQKADLFSSIEIAVLNFNNRSQAIEDKKDETIIIKHNELFEKVALDSIHYIESEGNYLRLITSNKEYKFRSTIVNFLQKLPSNFKQTHKGFIINIESVSNFSLHFACINEIQIPISKTYKEDIFNTLKAYTKNSKLNK